MKVVIIGGGASGIVASIFAKKEGNDVTVLERNSNCLKKLLITGNGRCNYFNDDFNIKHFYSDDLNILDKIINNENKELILNFFSSIGIIPNIKNGYYYPYSNQATSVKEALLTEAKLLGVNFIYDTYVETINKINNKFIINTDKKNFKANKVILSTGSKAYPKTGSDGNGYEKALQFGHSISKVLPSLVGLNIKASYLKKWEGVRSDVIVSVYDNNKLLKEEKGQIQLTSYGVSGIVIFNISSYVSKYLNENKKLNIKVNFAPFIEGNYLNFIEWFEERNKTISQRTIKESLCGFLNQKLVDTMLFICEISEHDTWDTISNDKKILLSKNITSFDLNVTSTKDYNNSQVCMGGVSLKEINPYTMESLKVKGLYFTGELLDVCGDCGGYNLGFAFLSGILAGRSISND